MTFKEIIVEHDGLELMGHISSSGKENKGWVIFAHGSGSSRKSSRNNWVARELNQHGFATLLFDLLTPEEDSDYDNRFNIPLLAERLLITTRWLLNSDLYRHEPIAYFGASTGAAAALVAAAKASAEWPLFTVIGRGGRPDLAGKENLNEVKVPVILIVGDRDHGVIELNQSAANEITNVKLTLIEGATHLFEEPGTLDEVVSIVEDWLEKQLPQKEGQHDLFI